MSCHRAGDGVDPSSHRRSPWPGDSSAGAWCGTVAPTAEPGTGIAAAALRRPEITAPTVRRSGSGSGRMTSSRSSGTGHPASSRPVTMTPWSRSIRAVPSGPLAADERAAPRGL
ncbi:hypothetical protein ACIQVA_39290 [Streptomyces microflavus]|uniref:hypothetical protein n=1 Tax=Streptomyces microflavus TaxID=1919 RepID=UPI00381F6557